MENLEQIIELLQQTTNKNLLSLKETADYFKVTLATIHNWKKNGTLPYYKIGRKTYFKLNEVYNCLKGYGRV
jgi:excisionase family DNA binding protein